MLITLTSYEEGIYDSPYSEAAKKSGGMVTNHVLSSDPRLDSGVMGNGWRPSSFERSGLFRLLRASTGVGTI